MITTRFGWGVRKWVKKKVTKQDWTVATTFDNGQIKTDLRNRTPEPVQAPQIGQGTEAENIAAAPWLNNAVNTQVPTLQAPTTPTPAELWQPQGIQKPLDNQPIGGTIPKGVQTPDSINPTTWEQFNADGTPFTPISPIAQTPEQQTEAQGTQADQLFQKDLNKLKKEKEETIADTKRGYALWRAKFEENKAYYTNYNEINSKYNAVIDEITSNISDTGVVDESVYQSIANKYWIPIEQVKNPNRILDWAELSDEGKEKLGVNAFEQGIADSTKDFERTQEDLTNNIDRTKESYRNQMDDAMESIWDAIQWITTSGAASGLFRSTALNDSMTRTREQWDKIFERLQSSKNRAVWDISTSLSRITEDFNQSITQARKDFDEGYKQVNVDNMMALNEVWLTMTGEKLQQALADIEESFWIQSQQVFSEYMNNLSSINGIVNENMDIADRIVEQEEARELKSYNEYLENDWLLLQATSLDELVQWVENGTITPESAQNLRKIMQSGIQETLSALAPLDTNDIDNINYLLEQGYTPEQAIAQIQETFDKFTPTVEKKYREFGGDLYEETAEGLKSVIEGKEDITYKEFEGNLYRETEDGLVLEKERTTATSTWAWKKLDDNTLYNEDTGASKSIKPWTSYSGSLWNGNITGYGGAYDNNQWLDIDGAIGDPIFFPEKLTVVSAWEAWDYGNSIVVQRENWDKLRFSHNDEMFFKEWDTIPANETFATIWNTGNVIAWEGWDGSHIDLVIERADWTVMKSKQVEQYINGIDNVATKSDEWNQIDQFSYAETLTASDRTKFLKDKGLEDAYIQYKADQWGENADFSDIKDITDINFADKTTEFKTKSFTFGNRMQDSEKSIDAMVEKFSRNLSTSWTEAIWGWLPNFLKTDDRQKFEQSQRNFINAVLRQESGAAIADSEFKNAKQQYMPQPWDSEAVMKQKKENRSTAIENMYRNSWKDDKGRNIVDIYKNLQLKSTDTTQDDALDDEFFNTPQTEEDFFNNL